MIIILASGVYADGNRAFSAGAHGGFLNFSSGDEPYFPYQFSYGLHTNAHLTGRLSLGLDMTFYKIYDDNSIDSEFKLGSNSDSRTRAWDGFNVGGVLEYRLMPYHNRFAIDMGTGVGISNRKLVDPDNDTTFKAPDERDIASEVSFTEIYIPIKLGFEYRIGERFILGLDTYANYLTGLGVEFNESFESGMNQWNTGFQLKLSYSLGKEIRSRQRPIMVQAVKAEDETPAAAPPARTVLSGRDMSDGDGDGVPDINDNCPNTAIAAYGMVDIDGCAIDTDCDGLADYLDSCPGNLIGAIVDTSGCPLDSDDDGVPDGLDDCPGSEPDLGVDYTGCLDLSPLERPITLNIKYISGSFEIDRKTKERLDFIARLLVKAPGIRVEINGYTDNIGTSEANRTLSQKRANRVRDYLVSQGVDSDRLMPRGRGETNFVASNKTREGRQKNRRVELIFFK